MYSGINQKMMPTTAKIIQDSLSPSGVRLVTMVLEYPRIIHSEFMTHRDFSRNASSSRAIPVGDNVKRVSNDPFIPSQFGKNKRGMQASEDLDDKGSAVAKMEWFLAMTNAVKSADILSKLDVHKQLANRLLEPFSHIQVVVTSSQWDNFFAQRLHPAAQPEIQELARVMKEAMDSSTPKELQYGQWHLPFVAEGEEHEAYSVLRKLYKKEEIPFDITDAQPYMVRLSVARCARVSYGLNERGWGDIEKDLALYDTLFEQGHWSPFEHQATPPPFLNHFDKFDFVLKNYGFPDGEEYMAWENGITHIDRASDYWSANFKGWLQYRQIIQHKQQQDERSRNQ
jgi:thymidylate synthase ThyX